MTSYISRARWDEATTSWVDPLTEWGDSPIPKSPLKEKRSGAHFST
jgi:hypothetical protein